MAYTLANLQDDIRNYTEVDSSVLSDSVLSRIIQNAENTITRAVDTDQDRFYATSNLQAGNRYVTIPSDLRAIRYAQLTDAKGNQTFLEKKDTSYMATFYDTPGTASGIPKYYANWDANYWVVAPTPDSTYLITLSYDKQSPSITESPGSTSGTYLSNKYQDLILYACLVNAYGYLKGPQDMLQYYTGQYDKALESYAIEQIGQRRRDDYQDGVIRAQLISKSPSSNK